MLPTMHEPLSFNPFEIFPDFSLRHSRDHFLVALTFWNSQVHKYCKRTAPRSAHFLSTISPVIETGFHTITSDCYMSHGLWNKCSRLYQSVPLQETDSWAYVRGWAWLYCRPGFRIMSAIENQQLISILNVFSSNSVESSDIRSGSKFCFPPHQLECQGHIFWWSQTACENVKGKSGSLDDNIFANSFICLVTLLLTRLAQLCAVSNCLSLNKLLYKLNLT